MRETKENKGVRTMTKTEIKEKVQELMLHQMGSVLASLDDNKGYGIDGTDKEIQQAREELQKQTTRMAKLFGYESWTVNY